MFANYSMGGVGMVGFFLSVFFKWMEIDVDDGQITEIANALVILYFLVLWAAGQFLREDLVAGLIRKKPLE